MAERKFTVIAGCMFSGKSEELLRQIRLYQVTGERVQAFKPAIDNRWGKLTQIRSHAGGEMEAHVVQDARHLYDSVESGTSVVAIDEVQFFDPEIITAVELLLRRDLAIIAAGLPSDFRGETFGAIGELLARADAIVRLNAICTYLDIEGMMCKGVASRTQRLVDGRPAHYSSPVVQVGAEESYAPRCPRHHIVPGKPKPEFE